MAYAQIKCPHCHADGRVDNDANSPFMMGRCPVCGGYVVYFCGASLKIENDVYATHSLETICDHILEVIDEFLESRLTDFLKEYATEFEIHTVDPRLEALRGTVEYADDRDEPEDSWEDEDAPKELQEHPKQRNALHEDAALPYPGPPLETEDGKDFLLAMEIIRRQAYLSEQ